MVCRGDPDGPGGRGHRLSWDIAIMCGLDGGLSYVEIGRDRRVGWREVRRNRDADGDDHAWMAHCRAAENAQRTKGFRLADADLCAKVEAWMDQG